MNKIDIKKLVEQLECAADDLRGLDGVTAENRIHGVLCALTGTEWLRGPKMQTPPEIDINIAPTPSQPSPEIPRRGKLHEISMKVPAPDYRQAYENEAQKFQQETRRTSEQSRLIDEAIQLFEADGAHTRKPWPKACARCEWLQRATELRARPINCYCAPNWNPRCPVHGLVESTPTPSQPSEEPVYKAVEKILDEESAWISRPSIEVTKRIALAATIAAKRIIEEIAEAVPITK